MADLVIERVDATRRSDQALGGRTWFDYTVVVRNRSATVRYHLISGLRKVEYDSQGRRLHLAFTELRPALHLQEVLHAEARQIAVRPGESQVLRASLSSPLKRILPPSGLRARYEEVDLRIVERVRVSVGYSTEPFKPDAGVGSGQHDEQLRKWARVVSRTIKLTPDTHS